MEIQIKKTVKAGNSSAVVLPRAWLNKEVRVELVDKTEDVILTDAIEIIKDYIELKEVIGIYLSGSYARGEKDEKSDIDILVITNNTSMKTINKGIYNIMIISSGLLAQKLESDLFPIGQMIKEAKPLLNENYLYSIEVNVTNKNIKWYLDTTQDKLAIIEKVNIIAKKRNIENLSDKIGYTLILRLRTLYIIKKLIENKKYSKIDFSNKINKISGGNNAYERYLAVKNNLEDKKKLSLDEAIKLNDYLKNELLEVKRLIGKKK